MTLERRIALLVWVELFREAVRMLEDFSSHSLPGPSGIERPPRDGESDEPEFIYLFKPAECRSMSTISTRFV